MSEAVRYVQSEWPRDPQRQVEMSHYCGGVFLAGRVQLAPHALTMIVSPLSAQRPLLDPVALDRWRGNIVRYGSSLTTSTHFNNGRLIYGSSAFNLPDTEDTMRLVAVPGRELAKLIHDYLSRKVVKKVKRDRVVENLCKGLSPTDLARIQTEGMDAFVTDIRRNHFVTLP
jgi:hypothetical protein